MLRKPKSRPLVEPDDLLDVLEESMKFVHRGIGVDPGAWFHDEQGVSAAFHPQEVRWTLGIAPVRVKPT